MVKTDVKEVCEIKKQIDRDGDAGTLFTICAASAQRHWRIGHQVSGSGSVCDC